MVPNPKPEISIPVLPSAILFIISINRNYIVVILRANGQALVQYVYHKNGIVRYSL